MSALLQSCVNSLRRHQYARRFPNASVPPGDWSIPFITVLRTQRPGIRFNGADKIKECIENHGDIFPDPFTIDHVPTVSITNPDEIKKVYRDHNTFTHRWPNFITELFGSESITTTQDKKRHLFFRKFITNAVETDQITSYIPDYDRLAREYLSECAEQTKSKGHMSSHDIRMLTEAFSFDIISEIMLGEPCSSHTDFSQPFREWRIGFRSVPFGRGFRQAMKKRGEMADYLLDRIKRRRLALSQAIEGTPEREQLEGDVLGQFLISGMTDKEMIDNFVFMLFAGHDTTATTMCWALYYYTKLKYEGNPIIDELEEENVRMAEKKNGEPLTMDDILSMKRTRQFFMETLRKNNPVSQVSREIAKDTTVCGYEIPKGWRICTILSACAHDKKLFDCPEEFRPSRMDESTDDNKLFSKSDHMLVFGEGIRLCPGRYLAQIEGVVFFHHLVTKYDVKVPYGDVEKNLDDHPTYENLFPQPSILNLMFMKKHAKPIHK